MITLWYKFLRFIGLPPMDLILYVPVSFALRLNRTYMEMEVQPDIKYWLDRKLGAKNWKCDFEDLAGDKESRVAFKFRRQRDIILFKNSWHND